MKRLLDRADTTEDVPRSAAIFGGDPNEGEAVNCPNRPLGFLGDYQNLSELPGIRKEVDEIRKAFSGIVTAFLDSTNQEQLLKTLTSESFEILHFTCHGLVNTDFPEFSGLVFPIREDDKSDNILRASEISSLRFQSSLAVLSACKSGAGQFVPGEGFVSLARAFLIAGVPTVVVSMWPVDDQATSLLMKFFYQAVSAGNSPAKSLQLAKLRMMTETVFREPYYWGGFISLGR
jgi:CHAT domain-containing protein